MKPRRYSVSGSIEFPLDMLRYDAAHPVDTESARAIRASIEDSDGPTWTVELETYQASAPNRERWRSFGWTVQP